MTGSRPSWPPGRNWWIAPHHTRWLVACLLGMALAVWTGGATFAVALMFIVIFAAGAALIALGTSPLPGPEADDRHDGAGDSDPVDSPLELFGVTPNDDSSRA